MKVLRRRNLALGVKGGIRLGDPRALGQPDVPLKQFQEQLFFCFEPSAWLQWDLVVVLQFHRGKWKLAKGRRTPRGGKGQKG